MTVHDRHCGRLLANKVGHALQESGLHSLHAPRQPNRTTNAIVRRGCQRCRSDSDNPQATHFFSIMLQAALLLCSSTASL
jgi:hypothetical protein